jgi:toxin ParE1/3/4
MHRQLVKDNAAVADLIGIWLYSYENWGEAQADEYLDAIETGLMRIALAPEKGNSRIRLREGYWSIRVAHHVVFYTFSNDEVRLRRVLHEVMDPGQHL